MPAKGKKGAKKDEDGPDAAKINYALEAHHMAMQEKIVTEEERQDRAKASTNEMRTRMVDLKDEFTDLRSNTKTVVDDLKRQYN